MLRLWPAREQKAREGKWNGGFAPYGYKLENGELKIAEDEADVIRAIYDQYLHTNAGVNGVAKYLNSHGYTKKLRQNGSIPAFTDVFVRSVLDNPVYMGKIAYGRRKVEKKLGTRNEMHVVIQKDFPIYDGQHEPIISEEDWNLAQAKRAATAFKRESTATPNTPIFCPALSNVPAAAEVCMGTSQRHTPATTKTRYYYYCQNTKGLNGQKCTFRWNP